MKPIKNKPISMVKIKRILCMNIKLSGFCITTVNKTKIFDIKNVCIMKQNEHKSRNRMWKYKSNRNIIT